MNNKERVRLILISFVIAFITLLFCTKNSPLYPFNDWPDENAFFTVGKSWAHGIIPYRDIFEQKGPLLYFLFLIGSRISENSFIGIFVFEVISLTIALIYCYKLAYMYLEKKYCYIMLPLISSILCGTIFFVHGGSVEEFCFPLIFITFYNLFTYFKSDDVNYKSIFIIGLIAGLVAMMKFNLLGLWLAFIIVIFFDLLISKKFKKSIAVVISFLIGFLIPILIFVIYFCIVGGFKDFIDTYITYNIFDYSNATNLSILKRICLSIYDLCNQLLYIPSIFILIVFGLVNFRFRMFHKNIVQKISLILIFLISSLGIYWNLLYITYYFLFLIPFCIFGVISIFMILIKSINSKNNLFLVVFIITLILSITIMSSSDNLEYMKNKRNDLVQYKFAKEINKEKNATILNYGFLDSGFYMASDILPNTKYFEKQTKDVKGAEAVLSKEINEQKFSYIIVIVDRCEPALLNNIKKKYKLVTYDDSILEGRKINYFLYKKL